MCSPCQTVWIFLVLSVSSIASMLRLRILSAEARRVFWIHTPHGFLTKDRSLPDWLPTKQGSINQKMPELWSDFSDSGLPQARCPYCPYCPCLSARYCAGNSPPGTRWAAWEDRKVSWRSCSWVKMAGMWPGPWSLRSLVLLATRVLVHAYITINHSDCMLIYGLYDCIYCICCIDCMDCIDCIYCIYCINCIYCVYIYIIYYIYIILYTFAKRASYFPSKNER